MPSLSASEAVALVATILRDTGLTDPERLLVDTEVEAFVAEAADRYSADRPRVLVTDVVADGSGRLALPGDFEAGFAVLRAVEHPVSEVPPSLLDARGYGLYEGPAGTELLLAERPSGTVRLTFTARCVFGATAPETTIPERDARAVCDLAASFGADAIAAGFARTQEPLLGEGAVAYRSKAGEWQAVARRLEARYRAALRLGGSAGPASGWANWDAAAGFAGGFLWHRAGGR